MNITIAGIFVLYTIIILSIQYVKPVRDKYKYLIRKSVHLSTGVVIFILTFHLEKQSLLILISAGTLFSIITYSVKRFSFIHTTSGSSLGTLFYPFGILFSFVLLYNMPLYYFRIPLMILTVSDTMANICGLIKNGNFRFIILKEEKSIFGAAGFALSALVIHLILLPGVSSLHLYYIVLSVIVAVNLELISFKGSDNFSIPVGSSLFLLFTDESSLNSPFLIIFIILIASGSIILFKKNILTLYGSIAAYLLGIYLFALPGTSWIIPVLIFFLSSVIFTRINGIVNHKSRKFNRRNIWQVFANIFFAVISSAAYIITKNDTFIYLYIVLIATVTADTWASELGPVFSKRCLSLFDFSIKKAGSSGGISLLGTIFAFAGTIIMSTLSYYLFFNSIHIELIAIISISAFMAVFVDSFLSAFLEPLLLDLDFFKNSSGSDTPAPNDIINLTASLSAPLFLLCFVSCSCFGL